jgi:hypothetical protein
VTRIVRCSLQVSLIVTSFLVASPLAQSRQGAQSSKAPSSVKVDWGLFLPKGEGQFQTGVFCSSCHTLQPVVSERRADVAGWQDTIQTMVFTHGADIQDDDISAIAKYLARFFGPSTPKLEFPIQVNTAPKETLTIFSTFSAADVEKIVDARAKEKIKDFAALETLVGKEKVEKYKALLSFD